MGGDLVESNVIFNMVRETGDHGTFKILRGSNECGIEGDVSGVSF